MKEVIGEKLSALILSNEIGDAGIRLTTGNQTIDPASHAKHVHNTHIKGCNDSSLSDVRRNKVAGEAGGCYRHRVWAPWGNALL